MAQGSTVYKAELQITDTDRHYYQNHNLTLAQHPSETDERLMMRLLAFAFLAEERLEFALGLSESDEPDLWEKNYDGSIKQWIMVGLPDEKQIKKAHGRSENVVIYAYGSEEAVLKWWNNLNNPERFSHLNIWQLGQEQSQALASLKEKYMKIQCHIDHQTLWLNTGSTSLEINPKKLK